MWPVNANVNTDIIHDDFYSSVERAQNKRFYSRLSMPKTLGELTTIFTSLGSVPEIRQMSGVAGGGERQGILLKDWTVTCTAYEWEQTVPIRRSIAVSKFDEVRNKTSQLASKAVKGMDRTLCQALISTTALGYDAVALFSSAHPESGTNQDNTNTGTGIGSALTGVNAEAALIAAIAKFLAVVDDQGTPVNEGVGKFKLLCHVSQYSAFNTVVNPTMSQQSIDASGATGRFRGLVELIASAYCTTTGLTSGAFTKAFLFAGDGEADEQALALGTLSDWQFNTNIGNDDSDDWNKGEGWLRSWAAFAYFPWQWQGAQQITFS
jgi:hypothetical protein